MSVIRSMIRFRGLRAASPPASHRPGEVARRAIVLRPHLTQRARVMLAFERRDLLRTNLGGSVWHPVSAPLSSRTRCVGSGGNSISSTGAHRLGTSRRSDLAALYLALRRRVEIPVAPRLPAVPAVVPALVN